MLTFLAALAVSTTVAAATFPHLLAALWSRRTGSPPATATVAGGGNPWPAAPAVAAGPRLYDHERVPS